MQHTEITQHIMARSAVKNIVGDNTTYVSNQRAPNLGTDSLVQMGLSTEPKKAYSRRASAIYRMPISSRDSRHRPPSRLKLMKRKYTTCPKQRSDQNPEVPLRLKGDVVEEPQLYKKPRSYGRQALPSDGLPITPKRDVQVYPRLDVELYRC